MKPSNLYQNFRTFEKFAKNHDYDYDYANLRHIPFIRPTTLLPIFFSWTA